MNILNASKNGISLTNVQNHIGTYDDFLDTLGDQTGWWFEVDVNIAY